ncbi:LOW QUALITY PROTEIN: mucin-5AC-like [Argopecten irradians]|uniref:LOW QUALITY PROTEIN: mucin-5AC-like n=1 Tax=Argopecten irradians TaxID=31199 RepID=UPI0037206380
MACDSLYFLPSEIARLVLGYLQSEGYSKTYKNFIKECPHLSEYVSFMKKGQYYPLTINGLALMQILEEYGSLRVAETNRKITPNPALSSLWCQFDSVVENIKKRVASNSNLVYKGNEKQQSRTRMAMAERRRNQIRATVTNSDPDIIQPHSSRSTISSLVVTQEKAASDYSMSMPPTPSDCGDDQDGNESERMSVDDHDDPSQRAIDLPTSKTTKDISSKHTVHSKTLPSPRSVTQTTDLMSTVTQNSSNECSVTECSTIINQTALTTTQIPKPSLETSTTHLTEATHGDRDMTDHPGSPAPSVNPLSSLKTPVKLQTSATQEPLMEKSPRRKRPPKRKPQGEVRKQNKSDSSILHGVGSHNESSNSTDGSALENSFPQILEHIMNDPLLPHKLAENINKSLHPEVIPDPGTPATLPPVDVVPESPFMGRSLEDILDQQETQMPASSINGIIELTEKDPNFEWLFSAGVCYLDEATHDRDFLEKSRSNGLQSSTKASSQHPQPGSSGCKDSVPVSSMLFGEVTSDNIHFTPPTSFIPDDNENNLFNPALPMSMPNFSKTPTSHAESFQSLSQFTKTREAVSAPLFQVTECGTMLHHTGTSSVSVPVTNSYTASQTLGTSAVQSVTMCVTAQPLETAVTSHQPITSRTSSQPITTAVTSIQPITSSFSSECGKETVETTLTSPHGFPVLSLRSSINDDDLPDPLASFTIQSPVKPCVASQSEAKEGTSVASASYTSFVSGMGNGQHSSTPIMARSNTLILPCITSSAEPTNNTSAGPSSSQMGFVKPHSTTSPKSLPTVNLQCLMQKLEAKAKGEIVELDDLQPKPPPKPSSKSRGRKKNPPAKKTSPKRVQPKPLNPSGAAKWSSELSALVKITSPEKSTPQATKRSNTKKTRVTRSSAAQISNLDTNQTAPQSSSKKTKKGNETVMAVLSPSGGSVHHLPVLEVNSLSEVADAKDLVPMGQLIPTTLPVTSSHTSMVTTQSSMTSQPQCFSSQSSSLLSMPLPEHISSRSPENILSTTKITITSSSSPFVQTDAPQTPPTSSCYTEYPSMPELCGTLPSLPVPATICDKSKDKQPDHATVLSDIYSADRDFLESPHSDIDNSDNHKEDKLTQAGVASVTDDLNRYCGIPIDKLTQRDVHLRPLDFGSSIPQTSQAEVSSPIRQPSFGRGKRTPATNKKKKIGRPPTRRSTRGKSQPTADDEIMNSPTTSKDSTHGQPQTLTRTGPLHERFESGTDSAEGITSQHISDISQQGKASQGNFFVTPSRKGKMSVPVAPSQVRSPYHEPVCTPHQDIGYSPASTPDRLTICTPTRTDDLPSKGDTPRQVLTLGNVGALSLQEVVNSPTYHDDATSRDSVISHHASSPSLSHIEQNRARQIDSNGKSDSKVKDKNGTVYRGEEMETQIPHSENENIAESEISSAVMSLQDEAVSEGMRDTPNPDALELLPYSSGQGFEHTINTDFQQLPTVTKDNNNWSVPKDTIDRQQSDVSVQSVTNPIREQNAIPSEMPQNRRYSDAISESVTSDVNTCTVVSNSDTINHSHPINQSHDTQKPQQNVNQPQSHGVNHLQQEVINQSQDHVVNQSQSYDINHSHGPVVNQSQGQFTNQSEENQNTTSAIQTTSVIY